MRRRPDDDWEPRRWGPPGRFVRWEEAFEAAVVRVAKWKVELGVDAISPDAFAVHDDYGRDDRGWVVSFVYLVPFPDDHLALDPSTAIAVVLVESDDGGIRALLPSEWGPLRWVTMRRSPQGSAANVATTTAILTVPVPMGLAR